jgi:hypothetical protein
VIIFAFERRALTIYIILLHSRKFQSSINSNNNQPTIYSKQQSNQSTAHHYYHHHHHQTTNPQTKIKMRYFSALLAAATLSATSVSAIQNMLIGTITTASGGLDNFVWFSDAAACATGVDLGPVSSSLCAIPDVTVLGHSGITFTGCAPPSPYSVGMPTGLSDGGVPSLTCAPTANREIPCGGPINVELLFQCA